MALAGVSPWMKRIGIALVVMVAGVAVWSRGKSSQASHGARVDTTRPAAPGQPSRALPLRTPAAIEHRVEHPTKLASVDERRALESRIATAHAARAATHAPAPPRLPDADEPAVNRTTIQAAMREVIPMVTQCYEKAIPTLAAQHIKITASLHLTGDPDVGTLVDADALSDEHGTPLPAEFDDCLRSTFMLLALPPLAEGDQIDVRYPFEFDKG